MGQQIRFSQDDALRFAAWSGDRNPLHVDPEAARRSVFARPVIHGVLTTLRTLGTGVLGKGAPIASLDVEFRGAVHPDQPVTVAGLPSASGEGLNITSGESTATLLRVDRHPRLVKPSDLSWTAALLAEPTTLPNLRSAPAALKSNDLAVGREVIGVYAPEEVPAEYLGNGVITSLQARVLALCSYIIGMEMPGLRSLFTRLQVEFAEAVEDTEELLYRARVVRFDPHFRLLDVRLDVATRGGMFVAGAELRAYVRFTPVEVDPAGVASHLSADAKRLDGQVVLVTGGSRGLGAEITTAFAMAGCHVYVSYQRDRVAAEALRSQLVSAGTRIELVEGNAASREWCEETLEAIRVRHGRLDILVLNACAPPSPLPFGPDSAEAANAYLTANLPLAYVPLAASLPVLAAAEGTVVGISSSFVTAGPAGFGHYVALKEAVESTIRSAVHEASGVRAVLARPPRLQTAWNDTPTGVLGTISAHDAAIHIVNAVARAATKAPSIEILSEFPALESPDPTAHSAGSAPTPAPQFFLSLSASFTAEPLVPGLEFWFKELGVRGEIQLAPYGQVLQTLLSPSGGLVGTPGLHVVMLRVRDWLRELRPEDATAPEFLRSYLETTGRDFERAVRAHRAQASAETLLVFCPSAPERRDATETLLDAVEADLVMHLTGLPGLTIIRAEDFDTAYAVTSEMIADHVREHIAHIPYQPAYLHTLATIVMRHVHRKLVPPRKLVAVDCDNTLWSGVVGEAGPAGVLFDEGHAALHAALTRLSECGVLIALCSKNEEADVWSVFDTRPELRLRRESVVTSAINWQPKAANLRAMAERLNLGLDSFVFIDDNPVECAEMRAACPQVLTLEWPQDPDRARQLLRHTWDLDPRSGTAEDKRRTELYKEEFQRQEFQAQTLTFADFIASLELVVDIAPLATDDVKRASQLTLRTNQFNFTTRRRDEAELQALAKAGPYQIRTVRVRDRFGDYGLVGLLIAETTGDEVIADTFLLSCRVLGRGVEHQMIAELGRIAESAGAAVVRLRVTPTERNTPARNFVQSVVPSAAGVSHGAIIDVAIPALEARSISFQAPAQAPAAIAEDEKGSKSTRATDASTIRSRESQIHRTAFELATPAALARAIGGTQTAAASGSVATAAAPDAAFVYQAFAAALNVTVAHVKEIDSLERLGCDSFKIVEITVSLLEKFPALPGTLLFEHRTVSDIANRITAISDAHPPTIEDAIRSAHDREGHQQGDIAVVGMHLRCAGANSPDELWDLLSAARVAVTPVPHEREYFLGKLEDSREHFAGLLDNVGRFDAELFGITPREAEVMDPQLRLFLEVAWGALEDAGCLGDDLEPDTGVFAGVMYGDYAYRANVVAKEAGNPFKSWEGFSLANRLSQVFDFHGPSVAVDTACSSSATAIHLACRALEAGDCRVAIAGGVNLILDPDRFVQLGRLGILSTSGRCLAFGAEADGTVLGEGAGVVVLRPMADALRRGDRIYGVIKATGVSTGSGTVGFTAPNPVSQAAAIRRAVRQAGIDPRTISYVETHGTGTMLGDPIEVRGLTLAYRDQALWDVQTPVHQICSIGSIKPNIGHLEAGAGVLGLIKLLMQLQRGQLLPSVTSADPNPQIKFSETPFTIQRTLTPWERPVAHNGGTNTSIPRRGALNSFGVGGANAHIIVEEPPVRSLEPGGHEATKRPSHLLAVSARSEESLRQRLRALAHFVTSRRDLPLADVCFSANTGQRHLRHRAAVSARTSDELLRSIGSLASGDGPAGSAMGSTSSTPEIAFMFTGQGSQHAGMGRDLYETQPVFKQALDQCFELFDPLLEGKNLKATMFAEADSPEAVQLDQTALTQPALFSLGFALSELWRSWGIKPAAVLGHSIGEITAMCVAGGLSLEDAATIVAARGRLMQALPTGGAMASVMATEALVTQAVAGMEARVAVAAINAPQQIVISGEAEAVDAVAARFSDEGVKVRRLAVSHAFHSPLMRPMLEQYASVLQKVRFRQPDVTFVSTVLGRVADAELRTPAYWLRNVTDPVRFVDAVRGLDALGLKTFIEIGPQPVLLGLGRQCVGDDDADRIWVASIKKDESGAAAWSSVLSGLAELYVAGAPVDWRGFDAPYSRSRIPVPRYPFAGKRHWIGSVPTISSGDRAPFIGLNEKDSGQHSGAAAYEVVWREGAITSSANQDAAGRWVIVGDPTSTGAALVQEIESRGGRCDRGLEALEVIDSPLRGVIYLSNGAVLPRQETDAGLAAADRVEDALRVMRSVAGRGDASPTLLWMITRDAVDAGLDPDVAIDPADAALWGAGRSFALEHPQQWGGLVDISDRLDAMSAARGIANELFGNQSDDQVALRAAGRFVPRLLRKDPAPLGQPVISSTGTYLITGGFGALGLHTARWLASRGAKHLLMASRQGLTAFGAPEQVRSLEALGASVQIVRADLGQPADVDAILAAVDPAAPLVGIFHTAGMDDTTAIVATKPGDALRVMGAKSRGAWLLHEGTRLLPIEVFVCFSSIASVLGSAGRASYAAANAFLNALAHQRRRAHLPSLSINWGPWAGGGMATETALQQYGRVGNRGLIPADALHLMEMMMSSDATSRMVADIDWDTFRNAYESRRARPLIAELHTRGEVGDAPADTSQAPWIKKLAETPQEHRLGILMSLLQNEVAQTLGFESGADVERERVFREMGMDSLMSADFAQRLQKRLGIKSTAAVFDYPTVSRLAGHLLQKLNLPAPSPVVTALATAPVAAASIAGAHVAREPQDALAAFFASESGRLASPTATSAPSDAPATGRTDGYRPEIEAEVFSFQAEAWPHRRRELIGPRWRWMFVESARRLKTAPQVWLHRHEGRLVGHNGAIPVMLQIGNEERSTAWLVDTMVLAEFRSQAVGARLMVEAHEDLPFALSLGQTEQMRAILLRLGWQQVAPLETAQLLIRPERVLKGKVPAPAAYAAGLAFRAGGAFREVMKSRPNVTVRALARFDESHDQLWNACAGEVTCAVRRDASYLNWKYVDQPGQGFLRLEVSAASGARGVVVLMFRDPDEAYKYRRAFIVDLVAPLGNLHFMGELLSVALAAAAEREADALLCLHVGRKLTSALESSGFRLREPTRYLLVRPGPVDGLTATRLLDPEGWLVTQGDSDIDRPW